MPMNKNAVIRYRYIDECLSHKHKFFTTREICDYVNEQLQMDCFDPVSLRCIQKDIKALEEEVFMVELERKERRDGKEYVHYADPAFSIFTKKLSEDEEHLLGEVLNTLGQFDGLDNFEWLDGLKQRLSVQEGRRIIQFSTNPDYLAGSNLLGSLFTAIANKQVIALTYHTFAEPDKSKTITVHPYLLKQYNNRWFLIAAAEDGYILNFALDRIDGFELLFGKKYIEPSEELEERFDDIVGVTIFKDAEVEKILLWVSDSQLPYIETKPIHGSQKIVKGGRADQLRAQYGFENGQFVELRCLINTELKQLLASFMDGVVVLTPATLHNEMRERFEKLARGYKQ
ncbi:MAG: WYL domain-containing protein [Tidjanibacter sp.]|nr:WYL domain-containing protein [Tidjanibacter sp.]